MNLLTRGILRGRPRNFPRLAGPLGILLVSFLATGCSSPGVEIATLVNVREYHAARYTEACRVEPYPDWCKPKYDAIQACRTTIEEAGKAFARGGKFPLQMKAARKACSKL